MQNYTHAEREILSAPGKVSIELVWIFEVLGLDNVSVDPRPVRVFGDEGAGFQAGARVGAAHVAPREGGDPLVLAAHGDERAHGRGRAALRHGPAQRRQRRRRLSSEHL